MDSFGRAPPEGGGSGSSRLAEGRPAGGHLRRGRCLRPAGHDPSRASDAQGCVSGSELIGMAHATGLPSVAGTSVGQGGSSGKMVVAPRRLKVHCGDRGPIRPADPRWGVSLTVLARRNDAAAPVLRIVAASVGRAWCAAVSGRAAAATRPDRPHCVPGPHRMPPCSVASRPGPGVPPGWPPEEAASLDPPCARRLVIAWPGRKDAPQGPNKWM